MTELANHSIKQLTLADEEVNRYGEKEPLILHAEMEKTSRGNSNLYTDKKSDWKQIMAVEERPLLVLGLKEAPGGEVAEGNVTQ